VEKFRRKYARYNKKKTEEKEQQVLDSNSQSS